MKNRQKINRVSAARLNTYSYYKGSTSTRSNQNRAARSGFFVRVFRTVRARLSFFRLIIFLGILVIIGFLLSADTDPIIRFSSSQVNARDTSLYRNEAKKLISKSIFNRSKLLFNYQSVEDDLIARFPEIESLRISFDIIGRKPVIQMQMQAPAYLFLTSGQTWVIDTRGVALGLQSDLKTSFTTSLHTIIDEGISEAETGKTLMSSGQVSFITSVVKLLEKQQIVINEIYIPTNPKEIDITLVGETWRYKLSTVEKATTQAGTLIATRMTLIANSNVPSEYVDLRSGEKVYWK